MTKIYRRPNIYVREGEKNKRDEHNRVRNHGLNFHVTEEEMKLIERRIELSGLSKSTFFIESCLYQKILVKGNIRTFSAIKDTLQELTEKINKNPDLTQLEPVDAERLKTILEILKYLF